MIFSKGKLSEMTSAGNSDTTNHRFVKLYNVDVILSVAFSPK